MSLQGRLEDLSLADIFEMIHLSRKSGVLTVHGQKAGQGEGRVVFHQGQILYASVFNQEKLGERLIRQGLIRESDLEEALKIQKDRRSYEPLGTILTEKRAVSQDILETVIREQLRELICELLSWKTGRFRFDPEKEPGGRKLEERQRDIPLGRGISPEYLLLEGARLQDEEGAKDMNAECGMPGARPAGAESETKIPHSAFRIPHSIETGYPPPGDPIIPALKELMMSRHPAEVFLMVLRFASGVFSRALILTVHHDQIMGLGQSGFAPLEAEEERVRKIRIPLQESSVFAEALRRGIYKGKLPDSPYHRSLPLQWNEKLPPEVFVASLMGRKEVKAFLYGDNLPEDRGIGPPEEMEVFLWAACLVLRSLEM